MSLIELIGQAGKRMKADQNDLRNDGQVEWPVRTPVPASSSKNLSPGQIGMMSRAHLAGFSTNHNEAQSNQQTMSPFTDRAIVNVDKAAMSLPATAISFQGLLSFVMLVDMPLALFPCSFRSTVLTCGIHFSSSSLSFSPALRPKGSSAASLRYNAADAYAMTDVPIRMRVLDDNPRYLL
ncbi:hypothetical protein FH972_026666 [Carpinus fangiana]|uniref:Uncharacterized protein n=1 Tax=Carpinus fangiana TaxID=176857 RepID=A0A5N6L4P4_9ROSI|nr:hypothetical protein FH972_026666 [Carpinus fangiana]